MREEIPAHSMSQTPRISQARIHLGWKMHVRQERTLSQTKCEHKQNDWPETTLKANAININPETVSPGRAVLPAPLPCRFPPGCACMLSLQSVCFFVTPRTVAYQAPLSMGFSRQEYCSGLSFPSPVDLPNPLNLHSFRFPTLAGGFFTSSATWEAPLLGVSLPDKVICFVWRCVSSEISFLNIRQ